MVRPRQATSPRGLFGPCVIPPLVFLLLAVYLATPMLRPGNVLLLDHALPLRGSEYVDWWGRGGGTGSDLPLNMLLASAVRLLGSPLVDRIWFIAMLTTAGWGGYALAAGARTRYRYLAGLLTVVNPWVHDRVFAGQWTVLLAYALLPWMCVLWLGWAARLRWRDLSAPAVLATIAITMSLPMGLLATGGAAIVTLPTALRATGGSLPRLALPYAAIAAAILLTQAHWILAAGGTDRLLEIGGGDLAAFATIPDQTFGLAVNVLALYGFWREPDGVPGAVLAKWGLPLWWLFALAVVAAAVGGAWALLRASSPAMRVRAQGLVLVAPLAFLFALGAQGPTGPLFQWAFTHIPAFNGFREPEKASALLVVAYATLGAHGLTALHAWLARQAQAAPWQRGALLVIAAAVIGVASYPQLDPRASALRPVDFPASWYEARALLDADDQTCNVLVLPWHQYFAPRFANGRVVSDPAARFFRPPLITADNLELPALYTDSRGPVSMLIKAVLDNREQVTNLGGLLVPLGVKYVVLLMEADADAYGFLDRQPGLERMRAWPELTVYRNTAFRGRLYPVEQVLPPPRSLAALVQAPPEQLDPVHAAPVEGVAAPTSSTAQLTNVSVNGRGAEGVASTPGWIVLTDAYDRRLELAGQTSALAYGAVNALFVPEAGPFRVTLRGSTRLWLLRTLSLAGFAALVAVAATATSARAEHEGRAHPITPEGG